MPAIQKAPPSVVLPESLVQQYNGTSAASGFPTTLSDQVVPPSATNSSALSQPIFHGDRVTKTVTQHPIATARPRTSGGSTYSLPHHLSAKEIAAIAGSVIGTVAIVAGVAYCYKKHHR
jgi:hypothetical protein